MGSGLDGLREELPFLTIKDPFLFKKTPSILFRYCVCVNEKVNSKLSSGAGVLATTPPDPAKTLVLPEDNNDLSSNPATIELLSILGLKSSTSFNDTFPKAGELNVGTSSGLTPASCKYESTVQKSP